MYHRHIDCFHISGFTAVSSLLCQKNSLGVSSFCYSILVGGEVNLLEDNCNTIISLLQGYIIKFDLFILSSCPSCILTDSQCQKVYRIQNKRREHSSDLYIIKQLL